MYGIIIQARTGSSRLRGKVLKEIYKKKTVLEACIDSISSLDWKIIIATTNSQRDNSIIEFAKKNKLGYYRGSEDNVLERYIQCAEEFDIDEIIRITSDNIFVQSKLIKPFIENIESRNYDYVSYKIREKNVVLTHWGIFGEYVKLDALKKVQEFTNKKKYYEHVTYYIYTHPERFKINLIEVPEELKREDIRLTLDTQEDFDLISLIYKNMKKSNIPIHYHNILNFIEDNKEIYSKMQEIIRSQNKLGE